MMTTCAGRAADIIARLAAARGHRKKQNVPTNPSAARRRLVVPRQLVRDLEPGRLRPDEDVELRANSGIVVEAAHRYDRGPALAVNSRHGGSAGPAEDLREEPRFGELVRGAVVFGARELHAVGGGEEVCGVSGGASPPATAAVAVHGAERLAFHDERDGPAETAAA